MFGHEDVLNSRNYTTTIKCISNDAKVFCVKAEEFTHRMSRDDVTWAMLRNISSSKDQSTVS